MTYSQSFSCYVHTMDLLRWYKLNGDKNSLDELEVAFLCDSDLPSDVRDTLLMCVDELRKVQEF